MKTKELILLTSLVIFDLTTKLAAKLFLPFQEFIDIFGYHVSLYLTYNEGSTGAQADSLFPEENNKNLLVILSCASGIILLSYCLFVRKRAIRTVYKILIGIGLFIVLNFLLELIYQSFWNITISSWTASVIGKLSGLALYGSIFYFSKDKWVRIFTLVMVSCGIGNLLSHFYPPFIIIDFIYIEELYDLLRIGVFNFADLAFDIGLIGLVISVIINLMRRVSKSNRKAVNIEECQTRQ